MSDWATSFAPSAAAAAVAWAGGLPPPDVITYALGGAVLGVWVESQQDVSITLRWVVASLLRIFGSAAAGVIFSAVVLAIVPHLPGLSEVGKLPRWALAAVIAFSIRWAWPILRQQVTDRWGPRAQSPPRRRTKPGGDTRA